MLFRIATANNSLQNSTFSSLFVSILLGKLRWILILLKTRELQNRLLTQNLLKFIYDLRSFTRTPTTVAISKAPIAVIHEFGTTRPKSVVSCPFATIHQRWRRWRCSWLTHPSPVRPSSSWPSCQIPKQLRGETKHELNRGKSYPQLGHSRTIFTLKSNKSWRTIYLIENVIKLFD